MHECLKSRRSIQGNTGRLRALMQKDISFTPEGNNKVGRISLKAN